ncbi:cell wall-binding repeat-containing protein [Coriobacteriia bacterium Es71-Z0120]|uniref:cell wall-binding repeat-containing protein n=1 Tax=Parvivirga hydrogeniphila TaxID=2939460 RepID=UPI002260C941|nr:cell wall-binding repeat-containing protein [Parvivirga hydrogeniphila]MCL4078718.1 cell wall-binding repeat-containing protein [Parvivirga hydrogeniphila]
MKRLRALLAAVVVLWLVTPDAAHAIPRDFFDFRAAGQAVYEEFVIRPELHYEDANGTLVAVYQGYGFDPYAAVYDVGTGEWRGPWRIADNPLVGDEHGGPALIEDAQGYYHVFYGAHNSVILHARSASPHDARRWIALGPVLLGSAESSAAPAAAKGTYPQPSIDASGTVRLFFRNNGGLFSDWVVAESSDGCTTWSAPEQVLDGVSGEYGWYASSWAEPDGDLHVVATRLDYDAWKADAFARQDLYYVKRDAETGAWESAAGAPVATPHDRSALDATCLAYASEGRYLNQPVVRVRDDGTPVIVFVSADATDLDSCRWESVRWTPEEGSFSRPATVADTDNLFDAGTLLTNGGGLEAYLIVGGYPDEMTPAWSTSLATRGGDLVRFTSDDGVAWRRGDTVRAASGPWERFNNPQALALPDGRRAVLFCEGDNDYTSSDSKVFLQIGEAPASRDFRARGTRLSGDDRYETAVQVSREAFPSCATTVVVATGEGFADAVAAAPLAASLRAPLLLVRSNRLDDVVAAEIRRLGARYAIIVGGPGAVSEDVARAVRAQLTKERGVERVAGDDRYGTSAAVARHMTAVRGAPRGLMLATGANFPDALAGGVLAARKNMPVLLTRPSEIPTSVAEVVAETAPEELVVLGEETAVSGAVVAHALELAPGAASTRLGGATRYDTAAAVVEHALARGITMERFVVCTGEDFPDALTASVLAARRNSAVIFTRRYELPGPSATIVREHRRDVLVWNVVGGTGAVGTSVSSALAAIVAEP